MYLSCHPYSCLSFLRKQESSNMKKFYLYILNVLIYMKAYSDSSGFLLPQE